MLASFSFAVAQKPLLHNFNIERSSINLAYRKYNLKSPTMFKDPRKAFLISLGNFVVPTLAGSMILSNSRGVADIVGGIILSYGILVGPSMGNFYAHDESRSVRGLAARVAGGGLILIGVLVWNGESSNPGGRTVSASKYAGSGESGVFLFLAGAAITAGGIIFNLSTASQSARDYNRKNKLDNVSIGPACFSRCKTIGMALRIGF